MNGQQQSDVNPLADNDELLSSNPVAKEFLKVKSSVEQALHGNNVENWNDARTKCEAFYPKLKQKLDRGDKEIQKLNKDHVVQLGLRI